MVPGGGTTGGKDLIVNFGTNSYGTVYVLKSDTVWHRFIFTLRTRTEPAKGEPPEATPSATDSWAKTTQDTETTRNDCGYSRVFVRPMYHSMRHTGRAAPPRDARIPPTGPNGSRFPPREYSLRASCQSSATATNDNQNEALSGAAGSHASTSNTAAESPLDMLTERRLTSASCATASMIIARCVGTVNPASAAYSAAADRLAHAAISAFRDATAIGMRNAAHRPKRKARPATSPTCNPEIKPSSVLH